MYLSVDADTGADALSPQDEHDVVGVLGDAAPTLPEHGEVDVVVEKYRATEETPKLLAEVERRPSWQPRCPYDGAGSPVDDARAADRDRQNRLLGHACLLQRRLDR
ncbi:hypothetical protein OG417_12970 [Actinoallomurus sp. NBC_01490]|nr:hypothetical protein [Actinoallomurus sp. NBC_01490]